MRSILSLLLSALLTACHSASDHIAALHPARDQEMTLGIVQRDIRKGMSADQVAQALGSPNIVSNDESGNDTWIYDKIATEASYSRDSGGISILLAGVNRQAGASATTQKTLTVVIKFGPDKRVRDFTYHSTKF